MIMLLAVAITFACAPVVSKTIANYLVVEQVEQAKIQQDIDADKVLGNQSAEQTVVGVNVKITSDMFRCSTAKWRRRA